MLHRRKRSPCGNMTLLSSARAREVLPRAAAWPSHCSVRGRTSLSLRRRVPLRTLGGLGRLLRPRHMPSRAPLRRTPARSVALLFARSKRLSGAYVMPDGSFNFDEIDIKQ